MFPNRLKALPRVLRDYSHRYSPWNRKIGLVYYNKKNNVGDCLNPFLISRLTGIQTYYPSSAALPSLLGVGSILHFARKTSIVWGSGIISNDFLPSSQIAQKVKIVTLRGEISKKTMISLGAEVKQCILGDPALLMPLVYQPKDIPRIYKLGIVPHLVDCSNPVLKHFASLDNVLMIRPDQEPKTFVNQLLQCSCVASSSLHGLILADAYGIPNIRLIASELIIGGDLKFNDYYSTTRQGTNKTPINIMNHEIAFGADIEEVINQAKVCEYAGSREALLSSLEEALTYL